MVRSSLMKGALIGATVLVGSQAHAGGIERGGYNIDLLFDPSSAAVESTATFVMPQRKLMDAQDTYAADGNLNALGYKGSTRQTDDYWSPRIGGKVGYENADCMFDYSQPFGAHTTPGANWAGAEQETETKIDSDNYALTCSYRFDAGPGQLRVIGGGNYLRMDGFKERMVLPPEYLGSVGIDSDGIGRLSLNGHGWGWRAGLAYEIPEYAFRASLVYYSEVKLNDISGTVDLSHFPDVLGAIVPGAGTVTPVYGSASMPDILELKVQTGIAPDWLAFGSVKWADWSQLQRIPVYNSGVEITSLDLGYRDGWTISGGIGHKFNDQWSAGASLTWDRGTSGAYGSNSDTWVLGAQVAYAPTKNIELKLGGALGFMTSGESGAMTVDGHVIGDEATYKYDSDLVAAIQTSLKVKF